MLPTEGEPAAIGVVHGDGNTIDPASDTTNKKGEVRFAFRSSVAGTKTITAVAGGVTLAEQPTVTVRR